MRRLALYSDQVPPLTDPIDAVVRSWLPERAVIGHVPSAPDPERSWFQARQAYYAQWGAEVRYFGLEAEYDPAARKDLFACDAIHLTGGNTFQFLYWLRVRGLEEDLRRYVAEGGVLIGVSAGAILMTPEVETSLLCSDTPYQGIRRGPALCLVDFAIVPHHNAHDPEVVRYAATLPIPLYAVPDGGAILVDGDEICLLGGAKRV